MTRGLYRDGEWAYLEEVLPGVAEMKTETVYKALGIEPPFESLPTKSDYEAGNA